MGRAKCTVVCHTLSGFWLKCGVLFPLEVANFKFFMEGKRKRGGKKERSIQGIFLLFFQLQSSVCRWTFFSDICPFQASFLLQAGSNLVEDQAIKFTFINSGLSCLDITSNLVLWHRKIFPSPHVPGSTNTSCLAPGRTHKIRVHVQ